MKKILEQKLSYDKEIAKTQVKYTWEKDEIAYYFCTTYRDVFKVKFTGERWFLSYRWGNEDKIYQYKYLESSGTHDLERMGLNNNGISHGNENNFYTTKQEAIDCGIRYLTNTFNNAAKQFSDDNKKIMEYVLKENEKQQFDLSKLLS